MTALAAVTLTGCPSSSGLNGAPGNPNAGPSIAGTWQGTLEVEGQTYFRRLVLRENAGRISGDYLGCADATYAQCDRASDVSGTRNQVELKLSVKEDATQIEFTGTTESTRTSMAGTIRSPTFEGSFSLSKR